MCLSKETGRAVYVNKEGGVSSYATAGMAIRMNIRRPFDIKFAKLEETAEVVQLPPTAALPAQKVARLAVGGPEEQAANIGFTHPDCVPDTGTAAVWLAFGKDSTLSAFQLLYGGPELKVSFPFAKMLGMDGKVGARPDCVISATQAPSAIMFRRNSNVCPWSLLKDM